MLKLTYTEDGFSIECINQSIEDWVQSRVTLALRIGESFCVEPKTASFLLPTDLPGVEKLKMEIRFSNSESITICRCDAEYLEVTLTGSWVSSGDEDTTGVLVSTLCDRTESIIQQLWLEAEVCQGVRS
ncbi:alr0857 family protein [Calothrix sp. PCC 6303]|uniref:alr0857 family protein n=1 Tax=Calothrix sp. PCC 6303 TaxID=1170562 RepID=UPI0002A022D7|nr:alr0857 family protein [Calothrix sp. PCC 6303]AFZ04082.1 hypothetical protein Cal6303_5196 [Calothrix sp. PCC 6303]